MNKSELINEILKRLDQEKINALKEWSEGKNFHTQCFIIDNLLPTEIALKIYDSFPKDANGFFSRDSFREKKKTLTSLNDYPEILSSITYALQDKKVVNKISEIINMKGILPDPTLYAGGLSMMFKDDFLNPHLDNSHDGKRKLYRRLNLLYYVTPDWKMENGGNLELWDNEVKNKETIVAQFNRLAVMNTNKISWHSVSKVTVDQPRCCVSNYYFSEQSPEDHEYFHVTSFTGRPEESGKRILGTIDNSLRNLVSKTFKIGRNKNLINDNKE